MTTIDRNDEQVMTDAVRLLKSDFVGLYQGLGFDKMDVSLAWHTIRTSSKGRELMDKLYQGRKHVQALSYIGDMQAEIEYRKKNNKPNNKMNTIEQEQETSVVSSEQPSEEVKSKKTKKGSTKTKESTTKTKASSDPNRGQKTAIAKELISGGETNASIIAEKSGAAIAYVRTLLYNSRKKA